MSHSGVERRGGGAAEFERFGDWTARLYEQLKGRMGGVGILNHVHEDGQNREKGADSSAALQQFDLWFLQTATHSESKLLSEYKLTFPLILESLLVLLIHDGLKLRLVVINGRNRLCNREFVEADDVHTDGIVRTKVGKAFSGVLEDMPPGWIQRTVEVFWRPQVVMERAKEQRERQTTRERKGGRSDGKRSEREERYPAQSTTANQLSPGLERVRNERGWRATACI
ncbi:hypothetical protein BC835DRAFT_1309008 [Cytidiella melzeri]|nr:hypothetical protein BC835DRAFT_1309008 [Cytidiella melzeri]